MNQNSEQQQQQQQLRQWWSIHYRSHNPLNRVRKHHPTHHYTVTICTASAAAAAAASQRHHHLSSTPPPTPPQTPSPNPLPSCHLRQVTRLYITMIRIGGRRPPPSPPHPAAAGAVYPITQPLLVREAACWLERAAQEDTAHVMEVLEALRAAGAAKAQEGSTSKALCPGPVPEVVTELSATSKDWLGGRRPPLPSPKAGGDGGSGMGFWGYKVVRLFVRSKTQRAAAAAPVHLLVVTVGRGFGSLYGPWYHPAPLAASSAVTSTPVLLPAIANCENRLGTKRTALKNRRLRADMRSPPKVSLPFPSAPTQVGGTLPPPTFPNSPPNPHHNSTTPEENSCPSLSPHPGSPTPKGWTYGLGVMVEVEGSVA